MSLYGGESAVEGRPYTLGTFQHKLNKFEDLIKDMTYQGAEATPEERRQMIAENLRYDQFCEKIRELFGSDIKNQDLKAVYRKISTNPDAKVDWSELFGYFQSGVEEEEMTVGEEVSVFMVSKRRRIGEAAGDRKRRDTVQCLKYVPAIDAYVTVSQKGALSIWTNKLRLQACIDINEPAWATGCDYLPVLRRVACCTERSIALWDNRAKGKNQQIFTIKPIEHSPQCMTNIPTSTTPHEDRILFGDDQGYVNLLTISAKDMTMKNSKGEKNNSQNNLIIDPNKMTFPIQRRKLHDDWVLKVKYFPDLRCFASCSPCSTNSFFLEELDRLNNHDTEEVRGVSIPKGVNCFNYCTRANIIATGGVDKIIRVWHPHIFSRPTGKCKLLGHLFTIIEIACNERDQHIISLSTARVFRVWDIHTLTCLQVFTDNEERPGEKRIYSMLFDNKHERLMTGSSVLDAWPLTRSVQDTMQVPHTHDRPLSQILYNSELHQAVSVCTESFIKVWEMETGKLVYSIPEAHGPGVEITALTLDQSGYRLVSGGYDGSIKIWDFGAGQEIKSKSGRGTEEDFSIIGLIYKKYRDDYIIIAAGWNNKIRLLLDAGDNNDLSVTREFSDIYYMTREVSICSTSSTDPFRSPPLPAIGEGSGITNVFKKDYVLMSNEVTCMALMGDGTNSSTTLIATGMSNGNVILWDVEKAVVAKIGLTVGHHGEDAEEDTSFSGGSQQPSRASIYPDSKNIKTVEDKLVSDLGDGSTSDRQKDNKEMEEEGQEKQDEQPEFPNEKNEEKLREKKKKKKRVRHADEEKKKSMIDPDATLIVETFDPIIVTVHQDSHIRFWNMEGEIMREITPMTRRQGTPVTAVCCDEDVDCLVTGDQKGYITMWDVKGFLEDVESEEPDKLKQIVSWRAHLTKIVSLVYVDSLKCILSGSTDGSVRVWWGNKGKFVGFFSQHRPFNFPATEETAGSPTLPYDITERPLAPVTRRKSATQKIRTAQKFEYPLIFNQQKWRPFRRSAYLRPKSKPPQPEDKKFFKALIKPRAYNHHLESSTTGEKMQGAVFRALPVYRVRTPERPRTPVISDSVMSKDEKHGRPSMHGTGLTMKGAKTMGRVADKSVGRVVSPLKLHNRRGLNGRPPGIGPSPNQSGFSNSISPSPRRR
ncbi:WD repeat-containing protein 64-like [Haliotis rubra]|uniref:WD repeat-containing protein 64-like n=1 Tax=Haliotis rubra TaxID=36100 RepID=UPI001EE53D06|nr:WD repeat-containing protein 64-like [Haliotis rubra]